ncbi:hypothetical protein [Methanosarcina sp. 1.H.A.2.2]|uniref:hypothetical protein n=1 Tax=Methanosarcina sp. 1.H.A.2.2 TaxID=1483601 RepID=UPI0006221113|nr:hypothetical protein [Methanosarcina sp. 1.H.A.2.2]KKH48159.1 hypothetical protein EO93_05805 [Methanosarcina sp. 1.H.A.2.2]
MKTKRNIAICLGSLLILMGMFVPIAVAGDGGGEDDGFSPLAMVVSPDNFVIETNAKYISVVIEDTTETNNTPLSSVYLDPESIILKIDVYEENELVDSGTFKWKRYEDNNDEDEDKLLALILMYERANLFEPTTPAKRAIDSELLDVSEATLLVFTVEGYYKGETGFKEAYRVTPMHVGPGSGKSKKPADKEKPETPGNGPGSGGSGGNGPGSGGSGGKGK